MAHKIAATASCAPRGSSSGSNFLRLCPARNGLVSKGMQFHPELEVASVGRWRGGDGIPIVRSVKNESKRTSLFAAESK